MPGIDIVTLALARKFTKDTVIGLGAIKGAPCTIQSIVKTGDTNVVTFKWTGTDGTTKTSTMTVVDGISISNLTVTNANHLIVTLSDGTSVDAGAITTVKGAKGDKGDKGDDGFSPTITVKTSTSSTYILTVTNKDGSYDTPNLRGGGGGGSSELTSDLTATVTVGGVSSGTTFTAGTELETVVRNILSPVIYPTFTAPSASLSYTADTYYAVGGTVGAKSATVSYNAGAITLSGVKQNNRGGAATNYSIATTGADTEYTDSSTSSGGFAVPALTRSSKGTIVLTGTVSYAEGPQPKDSNGQDYSTPLPAGSVTASKTLTFIQPYYYGVSNTSTISDFTGLTENVTAKGQKTFSYTTNNQYMVMAYDSSYGNIKTILDPNGFDVTGGWTKSTLTVGGFSYFVYIANSPTTDTNAAFTFKY